jgi:hypothetical protein
MNRNGQSDNVIGFSVDVMTALGREEGANRDAREFESVPYQKSPSYGDFEHTVSRKRLGLRHFDG